MPMVMIPKLLIARSHVKSRKLQLAVAWHPLYLIFSLMSDFQSFPLDATAMEDRAPELEDAEGVTSVGASPLVNDVVLTELLY